MIVAVALLSVANMYADKKVNDAKFRRSSLYVLKMDIPKDKEVYQKALELIDATYDTLSVPDAYNDFNLATRHIDYPSLPAVSEDEINKYKKNGGKGGGFGKFAKGLGNMALGTVTGAVGAPTVTIGGGTSEEEYVAKLMNWFEADGTANKLVAKWHNKKGVDPATLDCDDELVQLAELGLVGLSEEDKALITDNGGSLVSAAKDNEVDVVGNTYIVVNRFAFVSGDEIFKEVSAPITAQLANASPLIALGLQKTLDALRKKYATGYFVRAYAYLFQLQYTETEYNAFYENYWGKADAFKNAKYTLTYLGKSQGRARARKADDGNVISVAMCRALEKCYSDLQHDNEQFRPMAALHADDDGTKLFAYVGAKEGVTEKSVFDVFESQVDKKGKQSFKKIGSLKVEKGQVWDNRAGAKDAANAEDDSDEGGDDKDKKEKGGGKANPNLEYTTFQGKPGKMGDGHLIRLAK